jgi:hypothetical protein
MTCQIKRLILIAGKSLLRDGFSRRCILNPDIESQRFFPSSGRSA